MNTRHFSRTTKKFVRKLNEWDGYQHIIPFPHLVVDNLWHDNILREVLKEFDEVQGFNSARHRQSSKLHQNALKELGFNTVSFIEYLNSRVTLEFLEELTGIQELKGDPDLWGGGLHQLNTEGFLGVHVDFNWHKKLQLDRKINMLIYLNDDWKEEWGGNLEIWNRDLTKRVKNIVPTFNRTVIFNTSEYSWHGNPQPVAAPDARPRRSIAMYYYADTPETRVPPHSTIYREPSRVPDPLI